MSERTLGGELSNAMKRRGIGATALARAIGCAPSQINAWRTGLRKPVHSTVIKLADALGWDYLVELSIESRRSECVVCSMPIVDGSKDAGRRRYCTTRCQRVAWDRAKLGAQEHDTRVMRNRLVVMQKAVASHCFSCSDGFCPERQRLGEPGACALIEVSPYWTPHALPSPLYDSPTVDSKRKSA